MTHFRVFSAPAVIAVVLAFTAFGAEDPLWAADSLKRLTLKGAVDEALSRVPEVRNARERITESEANLSQAYSTLLPTVGSELSYKYRKDPLNIGNPAFGGEPYNFYDFRLLFNQPIFHGGGLIAGLRSVRQEKEIRSWDLEVIERDTTLRVIQTFYGVLLRESRLRTLMEQEQAQKDLLKIAQDRFRTGRSRKLEVLQQETQLALLLPRIQDARNQLQLAAAELATLLGEQEASQIEVVGNFTAPDWKKIETAQAGKGAIPELARNSVAQEQVLSKRAFTLSKHFPQVNASGYWGRSAYVKKDLLDAYSTNWTVGLTLEIPLFSGLSFVFERRAINSQQQQIVIEEARLRDQYSLEQIRTQKNLDLALSQIEASATALKLATEAVKLAKSEYRLGMTDYLQLFDAEQQFVDAEFGYDQSRYDVIIAQARSFVARGWPLREYVREVSAATQ